MNPSAQSEGKSGTNVPNVGPRGPVGPDVPLNDAEKAAFARRIAVEGRTAAAVQTACEQAVQQGIRAVFLPAGEYAFETSVRVPGGLTLLGAGAGTLVQTENRALSPEDSRELSRGQLPGTLIQTQGRDTRLFLVDGDGVRFTRLRLRGADTTPSKDNDTHGIDADGKKDVRVDHCEFLGFCYATFFFNEATAQVDHCYIHDCPRDGLGYGVAILSGAYVLVVDNEFSQNRHSLTSNGTLDWSSPKRVGRYLHKPGGRRTHWEFRHNRVEGDDRTNYRLCVVDTHPGMDGTFVVENNLFENIRHGVGIRDGAGIIRANLFRNLWGRRPVAISIRYGTHNDIPVEGTMPHDIEVSDNVFIDVGDRVFADGVIPESAEHQAAAKVRIGQAENITVDGELLPETRKEGGAPPPIPCLQEMGEDGVLRWRERPKAPKI